ncbi:MAG: STAS domain-containing protein [Prevotella sp.]|jgi:anti-anti-sigma factor|nr:STAS domain-containing protein [Prevotella sp.]
MDNEFKVTLNGTALLLELGQSLNTNNAPALQDEVAKYVGKPVEKVVFDASELMTLSSSGLRIVYFAKQRLGNNGVKPEIVFVNCAKEIYNTLKMIGLASSIKFVKVESKKVVRRQESLDSFAANNDVVCYSMKLGQED